NIAPVYDYGMIRLEFHDPNGYKLQQYTGANGWRLDVRDDNIVTTVLGYPVGGDMPNCPRDGFHLCVFVGNVKTRETTYAIPGMRIGPGASGSPLIVGHLINRNLGYTYSNYAAYSFDDNRSEG